MKHPYLFSHALMLAGAGALASGFLTQSAAADEPYKIVKMTQTMGNGGIDYVYADNDGGRLYVPRGNQVLVFDLESLSQAGSITNARAHGVAVDPQTHHGFCSSRPVVMWDTKTLETIKTIPVEGGPDGIMFEPATEKIYVLSHRAPNVTVIDPKDGSIAGTIDLGGAPEQGASDGQGHVYIDLEDKNAVAVVDAKAMKLTGTYDISAQGKGPGGLGMDVKNNILFAMCHDPAVCVVLSAADGKILTTLPIGNGTDGGGFNPATMEAFSSQRDGTLTIIKENSPTSFEVEQNVQTKRGAKTCTLDTKNNHIIVITTEAAPAPAQPAGEMGGAANPPAGGAQGAPGAGGPGGDQGGRRRGGGGPGNLDIIAIGK